MAVVRNFYLAFTYTGITNGTLEYKLYKTIDYKHSYKLCNYLIN